MPDQAHADARTNAQWGVDDDGGEVLNIGGPSPAHSPAAPHHEAHAAPAASSQHTPSHRAEAAKAMSHWADGAGHGHHHHHHHRHHRHQ